MCKKIFFFIIILAFLGITAHSQEINDEKIVNKIYNLLIEEYDKYKDKTWIEKAVLKLGRSAYIDSITIWKNNYNKLDTIKISLHPKLEHISEVADKNIEKDRADYFRSLLKELTLMGFKNLQIYFISTKEYLDLNNLTYNDITIDTIDNSLCNIKYYEEKKTLYEKENVVKSEIQTIMSEGKLKTKLAFYSFAFKFFNKIRVKIIERDMERMFKKINEEK